MTKQTFLDYAETKKGSILLSSVSVSNNILSAINATDTVADNEKMSETERAITLAVFDVIGIVGTFLGESKIGQRLNVVSWGAEAGLVGHRLFFKNLPDYNAHRDFNSQKYEKHKGYIPLTLIYDIIADTAKLTEKLSDMARVLAKIPTTPASIILNVASALITQVSASLAIKTNNVEIKPEYLEEYKNADDEGREIIRQKLSGLMVHKDDFSFAEALGEAMIHVLTNKEALFGVLEQIIHQSIPDILNPFDKPREDELIGTLGDDVIDANSFFDDPYMMMGHDGNDTLIGGSRDDHLDGGNGNDVLKGNGGNDEMRGEQGYDTYHIKDRDTIYDADGKGKILFDNKQLPKSFILKDGTSGIWEAKDSIGNVIYTAIKTINDLTIFSETSPTDSVTIKDFFTTATITGDNHNVYSALSLVLADSKEDADTHGVYTIKTNDTLHSTVHINGFISNNIAVMGSDKVDFINALGADKRLDIDTQGGNDVIYGGDGHDILKGGDGNDVIYGSAVFYDFEPKDSQRLPKPKQDKEGNLIGVDKDIIIGGMGRDLIAAGIGDDVIWVDNEQAESNNTHNNDKGDWALGGQGSDVIYGGANKDFLQGGADNDYVYGGGGDDVILGDGHIRFGIKNQVLRSDNQILSIEHTYDQVNHKENTLKQKTANLQDYKTFEWNIQVETDKMDYLLTKQKDIALANNYHLLDESYKHNANDFLYGGKGDDLIIGQYGNDYLDGGEGDDILWGDDNRDESIEGNDTLKGGAGRDRLIGGKGNDAYVFDLEDLAKSGADDKTIIDSDNSGIIKINHYDLTGTQFFKSANASNLYQSNDGKFDLIRYDNGNYSLLSKDFNASIAIENTPTTKDGDNDILLGMILKETKNTAPIVHNPVSDQMVLAERDIALGLGEVFFDADGDELTYSIQGADGLHFDPATKMLTGRAPDKGVFNITLTATDPKGEHANTSFTLRVNERPTLVSALTLPLVLSQDDAMMQIGLDKLFVDNDGDALSYSLSANSLSGIYIDNNHLIIDPATTEIGMHDIIITATDSFGQSVSTNTSFTIKGSEPIVMPEPALPITPTPDPITVGKRYVGKLGADDIVGDDKANTMNGLTGDDVLSGGRGNDTLIGGFGHDTLIGGLDNDLLIGGYGNDTYLYHKGDGLDTIRDVGGLDILKISGLTLSDLGFAKQGNHLFIDVKQNDDGIIIEDYFKSGSIIPSQKSPPNIERIYINDKFVGHDEIIKMADVII
ncbi:putative Ig domain-containing protein [Moraxella bovis]|uniref:Ig domain-containing protein n=1 Tax=Moraxella bovis TaxID=476 RepID=A0AAQ2QAG0_MORBO|nr:putative Ig domain-containing protein [Moraxella bovis]UYZ76029.1 putative Ig domain-containing protein [Moraxella bovis]UYZ78018.1 putative Ig domain-containing protein [Moraxella bovis]UYZ80913.1 putative Ig domain-containing protein [Moraxella bovis]UYZ86504.1 putative Ig domain-containing protein [Moraxella bovis]UYZ89793.1 putative Ig domain-containing protein [Moraxella bovis]